MAVAGYVLQFGASAHHVAGDLSFADYTRVMGGMLVSFLAVVSLSSFVTIVLLTVGAVAAYRNTPQERPASGL
jgi:hypothetical protein